jgi:hypothetical protein
MQCLLWSQMLADRSVIWFTRRTPSYKQRSIVGKINELPPFRVSARERSSPAWSAKGDSARTTSRPSQALKAFYLGERRSKSGAPIQGKRIAGSMVRETDLGDPQASGGWRGAYAIIQRLPLHDQQAALAPIELFDFDARLS